MTKQTINVTINLDGLRNELRRDLQRIIYLASAGLQTTEQIDADKLQLPTNSLTMTYAPNLKYTSNEIKQQYRGLIVNGFRDSIENVSVFLESAHRVLSLWKLRGNQNEKFEIKASYWDGVVVNSVKKIPSPWFSGQT